MRTPSLLLVAAHDPAGSQQSRARACRLPARPHQNRLAGGPALEPSLLTFGRSQVPLGL